MYIFHFSAPTTLELGAANEINHPADQVEVSDWTAFLGSEKDGKNNFPKSWRCATHSLNLVTTFDAKRTFSEINYKKANRPAFGKAVSLWNKQSRFILILVIRGCRYSDRFVRLILDIHP